MTLQSSACHMSDFSKVNAASPTRSHGLVDSCGFVESVCVDYMLCFQLFLIVSGQFTIFLQGLHEFATKCILDLFGAVEGSISNSWNAFCLSKTICTEMRNINQII